MPATATREEIASEHNFQQKFWENERLGKAAYDERRFDNAETKLAIARAAAEERGESSDLSWRESSHCRVTSQWIKGNSTRAKDFDVESAH